MRLTSGARWCCAGAVVLGLVLSAGPALALDRVRLQLRWQHQFQFAGYYVAAARGYYAAEGLEVEMIEARTGLEPAEEVTKGRAEYGVSTSDLLRSRARGLPVVALAAIYQHSPMVLLSLRESGIDSLHDLVGRRVAMEHEAADLLAYLHREGVRERDLTLVPHGQDVSALLKGEVHAQSSYVTDEPFLLAQSGKEVREFSPRSAGIDFYGELLFTSEREIAAHPQRVAAMRRASLRGWREALRDPERAIDLVLARSSRHTREHLRFEAQRTAPLVAADIVELGYMNPGRWEHIGNVYASLGLMPRTVDLEPFLYSSEPDRSPPTWILVALFAACLVAAAIAAGWMRAFRLARDLGRAGARWQAFVDASPQPVVILGDDGALRYRNRRARDVLGDDVEVVLKRTLEAEGLSEKLRVTPPGEVIHDVEIPLGSRWLSLSCAAFEHEGERSLLLAFSDVSSRKATEATLRREAETDPLTSAHNRRHSLVLLAQAIAHAREHDEPLAVGMLDVDRFKAINDNHGHALGDRVLEQLVSSCRKELRKDDVLGRVGGEEFLLVLPRTEAAAALLVAERLRECVRAGLATVGGAALGVTVSIGVATLTPDDDRESLLSRADGALYRAKAEGRDRVCLDARPLGSAPAAAPENGAEHAEQSEPTR